MLIEEKEEVFWVQDAKAFWDILTQRDNPCHHRYVGKLNGSRARKSTSKAKLPVGEDVYMSLLPQTVKGKKTENIDLYNLLWVDIDFKNPYDIFDSGIEYKLLNLKEPPNIILFSGKGIWALWFIEPVKRNDWYLMERDLNFQIKEQLKDFKVDFNIINPLKYIRIPASINSKNGQVVSYKIIDNEVKNKKVQRNTSLCDSILISDETTLYSETKMYEGIEGNKDPIDNKKKPNSKHRVLRIKNLYNLNYTRVEDLYRILGMGYIQEGNRNVYLHILSCQLVCGGKSRKFIRDKLEKIDKKYEWGLPSSEIRGIVNSAIKNKYKYKNDTIIEKLGLDIKVISRLQIIRPLDLEKNKELRNIRERASRRDENGLTKREQKKLNTIKSIQSLKSKGLTQKEISTKLGFSLRTVKTHWNI